MNMLQAKKMTRPDTWALRQCELRFTLDSKSSYVFGKRLPMLCIVSWVPTYVQLTKWRRTVDKYSIYKYTLPYEN